MSNSHKLRLVYSESPSLRAENDRKKWLHEHSIEFENPKIIIIAISGMNYHLFQKIIQKYSPEIIIDIREYPNFFSIFSSLRDALQAFKKRNIDYRIPPSACFQDQIEKIKVFLEEINSKNNSAPSLVFCHTKKEIDLLARPLKQENKVAIEKVFLKNHEIIVSSFI